MKKSILLILILATSGFTKNNLDTIYKKFSLFLPKLTNLSKEYTSNSEIHLGIAELYRLNFSPTPYSFNTEYQKVLEIDPLNRPANAIITKNNVESFIFKWNMISENLEGIKQHMLEYVIGEMPIYKGSILYNFLKKGVFITKNGRIILKLEEFEYAKSIVKKTMQNEYKNIVREIKRTQRSDCENSLYNYLLAGLYFYQDKKEDAIREIRKGINKKYCSIYVKERMKARAVVLEKINFPWPERINLIIQYSPFSNWLIDNIWYDKLEKIGKEFETSKKFEKAKEIYKMAIFMGQQCERNSLFIGEKIESLKLEMLGYQSLEKLYKKMGKEINRKKAQRAIKQIENKIIYFLNLSQKWNRFNRKNLSPKEISKLKILINQILEKGEIKVLSSLK